MELLSISPAWMVCCVVFPFIFVAQADMNNGNARQLPEWQWNDEQARIFYCISQLPESHGFVISTTGQRSVFKLTLTHNDSNVFTWHGTEFSVFRVNGNDLLFADWNLGASGGEIVAVNIADGSERWRTKLKGLGSIRHSAYRNRIDLVAKDDVVVIWGDESFGRYVEIKRLDTGETVGHKLYPKDDIGVNQPTPTDTRTKR